MSTNLIRTTAPITNVSIAIEALERSIDRASGLPGIVVYYGPSGYGKTMSACYAINSSKGYFVTCKSTMTRKSLLISILRSMGIPQAGTIDELRERCEEQLLRSQRPLILDEADYLVDRNLMPLIRDLFDASGAPMMLIGEEQIPAKLRRIERLHGRVLSWAPAQPASREDASHLARLYVPSVAVGDDLLAEIHRVSRGSVRRIVVNLDQVREAAAFLGKPSFSLQDFKGEFYTGEAPARRIV